MSSFGLEDVALFDLFWRVNQQARLVTLDTWRLPTETYTVMDQTRLRYNARIEVYQPDPEAVASMVGEHGFNLFYRGRENRVACCHVRKVEPLERALAGIDAWITGLRRDQGMGRGNIAIVEWDEPHANYKIKPARKLDLRGRAKLRGRARHPLQRAARQELPVDRMRALHAGRRAGGGPSRRTLVVGV